MKTVKYDLGEIRALVSQRMSRPVADGFDSVAIYIEILDPKAGYRLKDDADLRMAGGLVKAASELHKELEALRVELTGPLHRAKVEIDEAFKAYTAPVAGAVARLKVLVGDYTRAQQEAQRKLLAEAAQKAAATKTYEQAQVVMDQALQVAQASPAAKVSGVSVSETWDFQVLDDKLVPREFTSPDPAKIKAAIKAGVRDIPGVRIFSKAAVRVTAGG